MTVHPSARNLAKDIVRQAWPKQQPRETRAKEPGRSRTLKIVGQRSGGLCERCGGTGHSTHHLKNRSQGGRWSPCNCVRLCGSGFSGCHGWVTTHPVEAGEEGFHLESWEIPGRRPIESRLHGYVLLADDGSVKQLERPAECDDGSVKPLDGDCWDEPEVLS